MVVMMLKELERPTIDLFEKHGEEIRERICKKYNYDWDTILIAVSTTREGYWDLLDYLNYSLDIRYYQIFYDEADRQILIYDCLHKQYIYHIDDIAKILTQ